MTFRSARSAARAASKAEFTALALPHLVTLAFAITFTCGAAGCGGAPAAPQAPASSASAPATPRLPPPPNLSAVPEPKGLVVSGRVARLAGSFATVHGWTMLPMPQSEQLSELLMDDGVGALIDLDQPIDFAVAVAGSGAHVGATVAVAVGVRDPEGAKASLGEHYKLVPADNGVLLIQPSSAKSKSRDKGDNPDDDSSPGDDGDRACELAPAIGRSPVRLVCGLDAKSLGELGPWLTRTAPRAASSTDLHLDVRMQPLRATIAAEKRMASILLGSIVGSRMDMGNMGTTGVLDLAQAAAGDLADFAIDLDTLSIDVAMADSGASATTTLRLSGTTSTLGKLATANADKDGPPPAVFWQMPGDADAALFERGIAASDFAHGRELLLKVASDKLAADGVKEGDRHAVTDAIDKLWVTAPLVAASGVDVAVAQKALAAAKALGDADSPAKREAAHAATQALLGWRLYEIDEPADARVAGLNALAAAWGRPGVAAAYRPGAGKGAGTGLAFRAAPMPKGVTLPKDAKHFVLDVTPGPGADLVALAVSMGGGGGGGGGGGKPIAKPKAPAKPIAIDVFLVPDGARSWLALGGDPVLAATKVTQAMAGTGEGLRSRAELNGLKDASLGAAGFFTPRGVVEGGAQMAAFTGGDATDFGGAAAEIFDGISQLPHLGMTPVAFTLTSQPPQGATPAQVVATVQVPRGVVEDILVTVAKHGGF